MDSQTLVTAIEGVIAALEARKPAKGLRHRSHAKTLKPARATVERVLRSYWARQEKQLLAAIKPTLSHLMMVNAREAKADPGRTFATTLLPAKLHPLTMPVSDDEARDYAGAISEAIAGAALTTARELATDSTLRDDFASRYMRDNSLTKLTGNINETSLERLRNAVADEWDKGGSFDSIVGAIKDTFENFSDVRAKMIAQTEMNDAYNQGRMGIAKEAGFDEKSWDTDGNGCEEICQPNAEQGWIDIDEDFDSGDDTPPAHPSCDCSISFRKGATEED
jgi:hypothetical protein